MAEWSWGWQEKYVQETLGDPDVKPLLDIYAVHSYVDGVAADYGSAEGWTALHNNITVAHNKPLWMTETSDFNLQGFNLAMSMAKSLYLALRFGHISAWVYWSMNEAMVANNELTPLGYAFKNYYRFVRPGAVRIGSESTDAGILTVAFKHPESNDLSIVLINQTAETKSVSLNIPFQHGQLTLYRTSASQNCANLGPVSDDQISLPANSISTLSTISDGGVVDVEKKSEYAVNLYPNPAAKHVLVELPEYIGPCTLKVIDPKGTVLVDEKISAARFEVDTRTWPAGTYVFQISTLRETTTRRIVIP
jgi:O-glycosyl hydrolase